jgi:hypothetical protein
MAPSLVSSPRVTGHRDYVVRTLLHGMTGPLENRTYAAGVMMPLGANDDSWIAAIASYVRNSFGNRASFVTPEQVAKVRAATAGRKTMWTEAELHASVPRVLTSQSAWKVTASHNPAAAGNALTFTTWTTGASQQPGMWLQIELPDVVRLTEIQFESPMQGGRGFGGRGRGGDPLAPPPPPPPGTHPRGYRVEVSLDGAGWTTAAEGAGASPTTTIAFAPARAKFVRIMQTAEEDGAPHWAVQRLRLYEVTDGQ